MLGFRYCVLDMNCVLGCPPDKVNIICLNVLLPNCESPLQLAVFENASLTDLYLDVAYFCNLSKCRFEIVQNMRKPLPDVAVNLSEWAIGDGSVLYCKVIPRNLNRLACLPQHVSQVEKRVHKMSRNEVRAFFEATYKLKFLFELCVSGKCVVAEFVYYLNEPLCQDSDWYVDNGSICAEQAVTVLLESITSPDYRFSSMFLTNLPSHLFTCRGVPARVKDTIIYLLSSVLFKAFDNVVTKAFSVGNAVSGYSGL